MSNFIPIDMDGRVERGDARAVYPYAESGAIYYGEHGRLLETTAINHVTNGDFSRPLDPSHFKSYPVTDLTITAQENPGVSLPQFPRGAKRITTAGKFVYDYNGTSRRVAFTPGTSAGVSIGDWMVGIAYVYVQSMGVGGSLTVDVDVYNGTTYVRTVSSTAITAANSGFVAVIPYTTCASGETACYPALTFGGADMTVYVTAVDGWAATSPTPYLRTFIDNTVSNVTDNTTYYSASTQYLRLSTPMGQTGTLLGRIWLPIKGDSGKLTDSIPFTIRDSALSAHLSLQRQVSNVYNFKIHTGATATISSAAMSFAAYTAHSVCLRWDNNDYELDWDAGNVAGVHALTVDAQVTYLNTNHAYRSLITSPEYKDDAFVSRFFSNSGALFYNEDRLWEALSRNDRYFPLKNNAKGYIKL